MSNPKNEKPFSKQIKLLHVFPDDLKTYFVENVVVQHKPEKFILSFFEVFEPPIIGETDEERVEELERIENIEAKCVARLIVTPNRMAEFIKILNENMDNYQLMIQQLASEQMEDE